MLHASVTEKKAENGQTKQPLMPSPERERYPVPVETTGHPSPTGSGSGLTLQPAAAQYRSHVGNLQRLFGNQAVLQMRKGPGEQIPLTPLRPSQSGLLQRKCDCGARTSSLSDACEECSNKRLQAKLSIGASNDPLEQEADRVADQVLAAPLNAAASASPPRIQRFAGQATADAGAAPPSVDRVLASSGRPLSPAIQQDMGQRFGYDFSRVRVHSGAAAEQSAREVNANAYTVGHNIVFGAGTFAPAAHEGKRLIAHELTHVVQQDGLGSGTAPIQRTSYNGCADKQVNDMIEPAKNAALADLRDVIAELGASPRSDITAASLFLAFRKQDDAIAARVKAVFEEIRDGLDSDTLYCDQPGDSGILPDMLVPEAFQCVRGRLGYTNPLFNIHLCMKNWPKVGLVLRLQNLIHEGAHAYEKLIGDPGYFDYNTCAETASSEKIGSRLDTPDSYSCFVHYMKHDADIVARAESYKGSSLAVTQDPGGAIDLNSTDEKTPMFRISGVPPHSGFQFRWVIADSNDNRYLMRTDSGDPFQFGDFQSTFIGVPTRKLLKQRGITSAQVLCRVVIPGIGEQLFKTPISFTS